MHCFRQKKAALATGVIAAALVSGLLPQSGGAPPAPVGARRPAQPAAPVREGRIVGAAGCAAASCHGGQGIKGVRGAEYSIWLERDPHSREVLHLSAARRMAEVCGLSDRPWEEKRCLACHDTLAGEGLEAPGYELRVEDAVSCESCHGGAERWLARHVRRDWQRLGNDEKRSLGFRSGRSDLADRVQNCAACHVGGSGRDVDHDLIAAGHPRLNFEMSSHLGRMPRHWRRQGQDQIDNESLVWIIGQIVAAANQFRQLSGRCGDSGAAWPEFSEHRCYACHRDLHDSLPGVDRTGGGSAPFEISGWYAGLLPAIARDRVLGPGSARVRTRLEDCLSRLRQNMTSPSAAREAIGADAARIADDLLEWAGDLRGRSVTAADLQRVLRGAAGEAQGTAIDWDRGAQLYLLASSLYVAASAERRLGGARREQVRQFLKEQSAALRFPRSANSPIQWNADTVQRLVDGIQEFDRFLMITER